MTGARVQTMLRKKATLAAFLELHGPGFQKEGLRAIDAIFLRDGTLLQGRAVGWDSTSTSGKTSGERGLGFRRPRHPASSLLDMLPRCPSSWSWPRGTQARYQTVFPHKYSTPTQTAPGYGYRIPCGRLLCAMKGSLWLGPVASSPSPPRALDRSLVA